VGLVVLYLAGQVGQQCGIDHMNLRVCLEHLSLRKLLALRGRRADLAVRMDTNGIVHRLSTERLDMCQKDRVNQVCPARLVC
jgi:hypothetical protein